MDRIRWLALRIESGQSKTPFAIKPVISRYQFYVPHHFDPVKMPREVKTYIGSIKSKIAESNRM
jgi:hypothetical protein